MKLSLCAIVKNEATNLPKCLNSVKNVVDEIIVLDTGSSDRTIDIARSFGAYVFSYPWDNDFAKARNESLKYVNGDWVLVLDADEVLVPEIVPSLHQAIQSDRHILINLLRQEVGSTQSPYSMVSRLFRRHENVYFSRPYHAIVDDSIAELRQTQPDWEIGYLPDLAMLHYGYQPGEIASKDKLSRAQAAMEQFIVTNPEDPYVCSKLGGLYTQTGKIDRAIDLLKQGLQAPQLDSTLSYELHYHLGNAYMRQGNLASAISHYKEAIKQPILPKLKLDSYNNLGNLLKELGKFNSAIKAYENALEIDPKFSTAYHNLGLTLKAIGLFDRAIEAYHQALQLNPHNPETHQNLGVVFMKLGRVTESLAAFKVAIALHEKSHPQEAQRLKQSLAEMGYSV
jgi:tetratricopeptide (TPR) repeat protein